MDYGEYCKWNDGHTRFTCEAFSKLEKKRSFGLWDPPTIVEQTGCKTNFVDKKTAYVRRCLSETEWVMRWRVNSNGTIGNLVPDWKRCYTYLTKGRVWHYLERRGSAALPVPWLPSAIRSLGIWFGVVWQIENNVIVHKGEFGIM